MIHCPDCALQEAQARYRARLNGAIYRAYHDHHRESPMVVGRRYRKHHRVLEMEAQRMAANQARQEAKRLLLARLRARLASMPAHPACPLCGCLVGVAHTSPGPVCAPCASWYIRVAGRVPATLEEAYRLRQAVPLPEVEDMMDTLYEDSEGWLPGHIPVSQQASLGPQNAVQPGRSSRVEDCSIGKKLVG